MHLSPTLVAAVLRGDLPREILEEVAHDHLKTLCATCAEGLKLLAAGAEKLGGDALRPTTDPLEAVRLRLRLTHPQMGDNLATARGWLKRFLEKVPADGRRGAIVGAYKRYRGLIFGTLLLEEARQAIPADPAESLSLAEAALVSCQVTHPSEPDPQVRVPALAIRGNAKRALGRLLEAEKDLKEAAKLLNRSKLDDLAIAAEMDSFFGSLRKDQGRFDEAVPHLERAAALYPLLGDSERTARTFLLLGTVHHRCHRSDLAVAAAADAQKLLDRTSEPWLLAYATCSLAYFLHGRGDLDRAEEELTAHEDLIAAADEGLRFRAGWLRARIAWSHEKLGEAGRRFRETYRRAQERGIPFDTCLVGLELALVELVRGRTTKVKSLALEALGVFAEQDVERETRAALELLEAAARRDALTRELLERAVAALERERQS